MAKAPKSVVAKNRQSNKVRNRLLLIPGIALLIKLSIISRIQGFDWYAAGGKDVVNGLGMLLDKNYIPSHAWYGADGENYIRGLWELAKRGLFSPEGKLSYWPAGYPMLMWPLLLLFKGAFFGVLASLQSLIYAVGCAFFVDELRRTRLAKFSIPVALFLSFNPTLALNTIAVGYELPAVGLSLIALASLARSFRLNKIRVFSFESIIASLSFSLATFMQPRLLLIAFVFFFIWAIAKYRVGTAAVFLTFSMAIVAIAPATLMWRNKEANGFTAISTNLGVTMGIGAGPEATGGYNGKYNGVPCPAADKAANPAKADNAKVFCILKWYVSNPVRTIQLAWNKSVYFWSPWVGPAANGTMARNPWRINHPLANTLKTESGFKMVYGTSGKLLSWSWMLATLVLMIFGYRILWQAGAFERVLGVVSLSAVIVNWLSSVATIGDHRFRIPTMGFSLFLQVVGFTALFIKGRNRLVGPSLPVTWPGLRWKRQEPTDNLPS